MARKQIPYDGLIGCGGLSTVFFTKDNKINVEEVKRHVDWLVENECHTLVPGSALATAMDPKETRQLWEAAIDAGGSKICVMPFLGPNAYSIEEFVEQVKLAEDCGAKCLYFSTFAAENFAILEGHRWGTQGMQVTRWDKEFEKIFYECLKAGFEVTDLPVMMYNTHSFFSPGPIVPAEWMAKLAEEFDQFCGLKTNPFDHLMAEIKLLKPLGFRIAKGWYENEFLAALAAGCDGFIAPLGVSIPGTIAGIYNAFKAGDYKKAQDIIWDLYPILELMRGPEFMPGWVKTYMPIKHYLLDAQGFDVGKMRRPDLYPLPDYAKRIVDDWLKERDLYKKFTYRKY